MRRVFLSCLTEKRDYDESSNLSTLTFTISELFKVLRSIQLSLDMSNPSGTMISGFPPWISFTLVGLPHLEKFRKSNVDVGDAFHKKTRAIYIHSLGIANIFVINPS